MCRYLLLIISIVFPSHVFADTSLLELMKSEDLAKLYTCPNDTSQTCTNSVLQNTISHYINQSHARDQYSGKIIVESSIDDSEKWKIQLPPNTPLAYHQALLQFLDIGNDALEASRKVREAGIWDPKWRFFLQLGLPILNNKAVHLLHFPPDTVLDTQDYLKAATIRRWGRLLQENGVAFDDTTLYQPVADIAPIATKANDGESLTPTYPFFKSYVYQMLNLLGVDGEKSVKPIVAGGYPAREWVKDESSLSTFKSLEMTIFKTESGVKLPLIGSHHPSFIWYASRRYRESNPEKAYEVDMAVMTADLVAACWKKRMADSGLTVTSSNKTMKKIMDSTFAVCSQKWLIEKKVRVCELVQKDVYRMSNNDARNLCQQIETTESGKQLSEKSLMLQDEIYNIEVKLGL